MVDKAAELVQQADQLGGQLTRAVLAGSFKSGAAGTAPHLVAVAELAVVCCRDQIPALMEVVAGMYES